MTLENLIREFLGVSIERISDHVGLSYYKMSQMLNGEIEMPEDIREKIKIFLLSNYT